MQQSAYKSADVYQVGFAARLLGTNEFKLFEDAYHAWYGEKSSEELLEHFFNHYLLENAVPFWVRNYVRTFLNDPALQERLGRKKSCRLLLHCSDCSGIRRYHVFPALIPAG